MRGRLGAEAPGFEFVGSPMIKRKDITSMCIARTESSSAKTRSVSADARFDPLEGTTSGLCSIVVNKAVYPAGFSIGVSAFNSSGESAPVRF